MATALEAQHARSEMSLTVPPEFERAIRERVESGAYASADAVFRACLEALAEWEDVQRVKHEQMRADILVGSDQADRGKVVDGPEAFARARARLIEKTAPRNEIGALQRDFDALGAEIQSEVDRIKRGETVNQEVVLDRMRERYGDECPQNDEFFRRMNAWRIAERIARGRYQSAGDVIHSALCWMEEGEAADAADDELREAIEEGFRSAETEPLIPADEMVAHMHAIIRGERP